MRRVPTAVLLVALAAGPAAGGEVEVDLLSIDDAGNAADSNGSGTVAEVFRIGRFEVTNTQYVAFLNAVAAADPNGLYADLMTDSDRGGILRSGSPGSFTYQVKPDFHDKPVNAVGWPDAARFCNWLHHGQPAGAQGPGTTEDGAYDMSMPIDQIRRSAAATWFIPTHDEWYKAAYYDPIDGYWPYPTASDSIPSQAMASATGDVTNPGPNVANYGGGADWNGENGNVTTVGGCEAASPWGAFDMGGNVLEWTETPGTPIPPNPPDQPDPLPTRLGRGGDFANAGILMSSLAGFALDLNMVAEAANVGFRVAAIDEPGVPGDVNGDGVTDVQDLTAVILGWGDCPPRPGSCPADLDGDGTVDVLDLVQVIINWS